MQDIKDVPMYSTYIYWKENERTIKNRIQVSFELDYDLK